jgi:hypothetical protein
MKRKLFFMSALAIMVAGGIFWACQKDDIVFNSEGELMLKSESVIGGITYLDSYNDPDDVVITEVECSPDIPDCQDEDDNPQCIDEPYVKCVDLSSGEIKIWNDNDKLYIQIDLPDVEEFEGLKIVPFKETDDDIPPNNGPGNVNLYFGEGDKIFEHDEEDPESDPKQNDVQVEYTLPEDWEACSDKRFDIRIEGLGGNPQHFFISYTKYEICEDECEWIGETAWADGTRYVEQGNWATYTTYEADANVTLWAGQDMDAGTVHFSEADASEQITITIVLNEGWRLKPGEWEWDEDLEEEVWVDEEESVKIQGYGDAPSGNPDPGQFTTYKGTELTVTIDAYDFYGVHLDVEYCADDVDDENGNGGNGE